MGNVLASGVEDNVSDPRTSQFKIYKISSSLFHKKRMSNVDIRKRQILVCDKNTNFNKKLSETDIMKMLSFFIDNIFVMFGRRGYQQTVRNLIVTNYGPFLVDLFV